MKTKKLINFGNYLFSSLPPSASSSSEPDIRAITRKITRRDPNAIIAERTVEWLKTGGSILKSIVGIDSVPSNWLQNYLKAV